MRKIASGLTKTRLVDLVEALCRALPTRQLPKLLARHLDLAAPRAEPRSGSPDRLLRDVRAFHKASLAGDFYEPFGVNSRNFTMKSDATVAWGEDCQTLLKRCQAASEAKRYAPAREAFDLLLDLLEHIDRGEDIVFFADEGGSWEVADLDPIWPAYFASLAATADPAEYVSRAQALARWHTPGRSEGVLRAARKAATPDQRRHLRAVAVSSRVRPLRAQ